MTLVVVLVGWEATTRGGLIAPYLLPAPSTIAVRLAGSWNVLVPHTLVTTFEIVIGFLLAVVGGIFLAIATAYVPFFERSVYPWIVASQAIPKVAVGPLFVLWLGFGLLPKIVIAFLIAFFPIMVDTVVGLRSVEADSVLLLRSMGARRWKTFVYLNLPAALPNIFAGMKVAITLATIGAIVGEFIGANEGLGYVLILASGNLDAPLVFAVLFLISALAVIFYAAVGLIEDFFIWWHVSKRTSSGSRRLSSRQSIFRTTGVFATERDQMLAEPAGQARKSGGANNAQEKSAI
jgi:NitT/TauT family transport system permease protein